MSGAPLAVSDSHPSRAAESRPHLRLDLMVTFGTEFTILAASLLVLRMAARHWGPEGFGDYVLARRSLGWVQLPVLCGMHLALARYVAMAEAGHDREGASAYLRGGAAILTTSVAVTTLCFLAFAPWLAFLLLGDAGQAETIRVLVLPLTGIVMHSATYGALRGRRMMRAANGLQAFGLGVLPLGAILIPSVTVRWYLALVGGGWVLGSLLALGYLSWRSERATVQRAPVTRRVRELFRYGFLRVPGEVSLGALFTLPATLAAHSAGAVAAGQIGLGLSVVQLVGAMFSPLGQVLLPAISAQLARGEIGALRRRIRRTAFRGVLLALVMVTGLELVMPWLLSDFFGPAFLPALPVVRIMALGGLPYAVYVLLRSVLDAVHPRPMNARNLVYGIAAFLGVAFLSTPLAIPIGVVAAMTVVGVRTAFDVYQHVYREGVLAAPASVAVPSPNGSA